MVHPGTLPAARGLFCIALMFLVSACSPQVVSTLAPLPAPPMESPAERPWIAESLNGEKSASAVSLASDLGEPGWAVHPVRPWKYIVIHHSATPDGSVEQFDLLHRSRGMDELGYHFVITNGNGGPDGKVQVGSRWWRQKWGAHTGATPGNEYNNFGIGICLVGDFTDRVPSDAQLTSLRRLVLYLIPAHEIAPENVVEHREAPNASTACPGETLHAYLHSTFRPSLKRIAVHK